MTLTTGFYADSRVQTRPYLAPLTGCVATADTPFPSQCILLFRVRGPFNTGGTVAAQRPGGNERAFVIDRLLTGALRTTFSIDGLAAGTTVAQTGLVPVSGGDEELALSMETGGIRRMRSWRRSAGSWIALGSGESTTAVTPYDSSAPIRVGSYGAPGNMSVPWDGRIYHAELRTGLEPYDPLPAALNFPNVAGTYLSVSPQTGLDHNGDIEIVLRCSQSIAAELLSHSYVSRAGAVGNRAWQFGYYNSRYRWNFSTAAVPGTYYSFQPNAGMPVNDFRWIKITRVSSDGIVTMQWAHDQQMEPTIWNHYVGSPSAPGAYATGPLVNSTSPFQIGGRIDGGSEPGAGGLRRLIIRNSIGGPAVLDYDEALIPNASATSFLARTGQTLTVIGDPLDPVTPPTTVWRFDARDYPGSGLSYVDPRGRTWTLDNAGAIVP